MINRGVWVQFEVARKETWMLKEDNAGNLVGNNTKIKKYRF